MPLVEVIRGRETSDETVATAVAYAKSIGKSPIVVHDGPGFLVNRLLFPYLNESLELLAKGHRSKRSNARPPISACRWARWRCTTWSGSTRRSTPAASCGRRFPTAPVPRRSCRPWSKPAGWVRKRPRLLPLSRQKRAQRARPGAGRLAGDLSRGERKFSPDELSNRLLLPMVLEATRILEAKLVRDVRDVDLGVIFGLGFPAVSRRTALLGRYVGGGQDRRAAQTVRGARPAAAAHAPAVGNGRQRKEILRPRRAGGKQKPAPPAALKDCVK
jgi:hypothetical protein